MATDSDQCSGNTTQRGRVVFIPRRQRPTVRRPYADGARRTTQVRLHPLESRRFSTGVGAVAVLAGLYLLAMGLLAVWEAVR